MSMLKPNIKVSEKKRKGATIVVNAIARIADLKSAYQSPVQIWSLLRFMRPIHTISK